MVSSHVALLVRVSGDSADRHISRPWARRASSVEQTNSRRGESTLSRDECVHNISRGSFLEASNT